MAEKIKVTDSTALKKLFQSDKNQKKSEQNDFFVMPFQEIHSSTLRKTLIDSVPRPHSLYQDRPGNHYSFRLRQGSSHIRNARKAVNFFPTH